MKLAVIALLSLLLAGAAGAQPVPVGSAIVGFKEKLTVGPGCEPYKGVGVMIFVVLPDGSFLARTDAGDFTGTLVPVDRKGRVWRLRFDHESETFYGAYLEAGASVLCDTPVSLASLRIESFILRLTEQGTRVSLQLKASATGASAFGPGRGSHQLKGRGSLAPLVLPAPPPSNGGAVIILRPPV